MIRGAGVKIAIWIIACRSGSHGSNTIVGDVFFVITVPGNIGGMADLKTYLTLGP
jgi:hypothetical protein